MRKARNVSFVVLCLAMFASWQASTQARVPCSFYWCEHYQEAPTEAQGCSFEIENEIDLWLDQDSTGCPAAVNDIETPRSS